jgi:hypothetical protein
VHLREPALPEVDITKALAERAAKSFHVIVSGLEAVGIRFRNAQGSHGSGFFRKGHDRLYLNVEEYLTDHTAGPRASTRRWYSSGAGAVASGFLTFSFKSQRYGGPEAKQWHETGKTSLDQLLAQIVTAIRRHFVEAVEKRVRDAIENEKRRVEAERHWREYQRKEAIREEQERRRKHAEALDSVTQRRAENLLKAAEWWRLHGVLVEFVQECEKRWRNGQQGNLTPEQEAWIAWARKNAEMLSVFESGYPDPAKDGVFDAASIPQGGPYPEKRKIPRPPTMPKIPQPAPQNTTDRNDDGSRESPYPFWLKFQHTMHV